MDITITLKGVNPDRVDRITRVGTRMGRHAESVEVKSSSDKPVEEKVKKGFVGRVSGSK